VALAVDASERSFRGRLRAVAGKRSPAAGWREPKCPGYNGRGHNDFEPLKQAISKSNFEPRAPEFFRQLQETGGDPTITERETSVLMIVPYREMPDQAREALRDAVRNYLMPTEPVSVGVWESLN